MGLAAAEAAVAVEIAESVRRSLMEDESRRGRIINDNSNARAQPGGDIDGVERVNRTRWDFPEEFAWYTEIAEAVARSMAEETQLMHGSNAESRHGDRGELGVDPDVLAALDEAVLHIHEANIFGRRAPMGALRAPMARQEAQGCHRSADDPHDFGNFNLADFNVSDVVGIAHAVLRSLDEEAAARTRP